ncbi:MAG: RNA polymerase sigma-54 factor [Paraglaciecola sp.]|jgi:RNA polymerase sigma-54 factor
MLRQNLSHKMLQKLSPQQIQLMKLLQIPTATLEQRIEEELEANPALEEGEEGDEVAEIRADDKSDKEDDDYSEAEVDEPSRDEEFELDDYLTDYIEDDPSSYKLKADIYSADDEDKSIPVAVENTFHEYLDEQLGMLQFADDREELIAKQIVGSIDEDGYLRREPSAIIDDLMFSQNVIAREEEVKAILDKIQHFDPPGIGASNLQECLRLQLEYHLKKEGLEGEELKSMKYALRIINHYFDEFTKKHYQKLQRGLSITEEQLKDAVDEILKCNPKPASGFTDTSTRNTHYVVPDFIIVNRDGELELTLNSRNAPDLRINEHYKDMLKAYKVNTKGRRAQRKEKEAVMFIKQKIDSAKWFIDAIRQRQQTMYKSMYSIMQYQYDYFLTGDQKRLRPMILKDIADITGLDISTVSRVANSKFVQTEFGTMRLKDFFSESLQTKDGEEVSTLEVKKILTEIIADESKKKPLSDEKLKNILREEGYNIARRTVAKYREQLNIPVARLRKEL